MSESRRGCLAVCSEADHKLCRLGRGRGVGSEVQKSPILSSKKTSKWEGGGQKPRILRRHSLWTAPWGTYAPARSGETRRRLAP